MPHNKHLDKKGSNCQFRNHKIFNPRKTLDSHHSSFSICLCSVHQFLIIIYCQFICCCLSVVVRLLAGCFNSHSFVSVRYLQFCSCFDRFFFVRLFSIQLFDYSVLISVLLVELYSTYFFSHVNNPPASQ
jgi:hypothetical protein